MFFFYFKMYLHDVKETELMQMMKTVLLVGFTVDFHEHQYLFSM
jgi:hypothetical protein